MALVNEGYLHHTDIKKFFKFFYSETANKKIGYGPLKDSGERSRAILAHFLIIAGFCSSLQHAKALPSFGTEQAVKFENRNLHVGFGREVITQQAEKVFYFLLYINPFTIRQNFSLVQLEGNCRSDNFNGAQMLVFLAHLSTKC